MEDDAKEEQTSPTEDKKVTFSEKDEEKETGRKDGDGDDSKVVTFSSADDQNGNETGITSRELSRDDALLQLYESKNTEGTIPPQSTILTQEQTKEETFTVDDVDEDFETTDNSQIITSHSVDDQEKENSDLKKSDDCASQNSNEKEDNNTTDYFVIKEEPSKDGNENAKIITDEVDVKANENKPESPKQTTTESSGKSFIPYGTFATGRKDSHSGPQKQSQQSITDDGKHVDTYATGIRDSHASPRKQSQQSITDDEKHVHRVSQTDSYSFNSETVGDHQTPAKSNSGSPKCETKVEERNHRSSSESSVSSKSSRTSFDSHKEVKHEEKITPPQNMSDEDKIRVDENQSRKSSAQSRTGSKQSESRSQIHVVLPEPDKIVKNEEKKKTTPKLGIHTKIGSNQKVKQTDHSRVNTPMTRQQVTPSPRAIVAQDRPNRRQVKSAHPDTRAQPRDHVTSSSSRTRPTSRPKTSVLLRKPASQEARRKQFFKEELKRLQQGLKKESSKIKKPPERDYYPYVFTSLEPYYNSTTAEYLINMPDEVVFYDMASPRDKQVLKMYRQEKKEKEKKTGKKEGELMVSRDTAIGLCDPWVDHRMDRTILPKLETSMGRKLKHKDKKESAPKSGKSDSGSRPKKEGSTRLPEFPKVTLPTQEYTTKQLYYSDVPMLREELRNKYSGQAKDKVDKDYKRTKADFYRMELDRLEEYHEINRPHMRNAYFAYLQNTPGSKKAIYDCMKHVSGGVKKSASPATPKAAA